MSRAPSALRQLLRTPPHHLNASPPCLPGQWRTGGGKTGGGVTHGTVEKQEEAAKATYLAAFLEGTEREMSTGSFQERDL